MRGIRMRFEEQPGLCRKTRQAIPAAIRRGLEKRPEVAYACSTPTTCCATPEGTERQEEDVAQDLGGLQEYRRITPMALSALQAAADAGEPRVRPESLAGQATTPGFSSPTPPARRRTSPAGGAGRHRTGCAVRRGGCRRGFPYRAADRRGAGPAPARWHGRQGAGANGGSAALDGMQGRGCPDIALAELAFELGEGPACPERSAATPGRSAPGCRRNARRCRPRASTSSPASAAVAGAPLAPLLPR